MGRPLIWRWRYYVSSKKRWWWGGGVEGAATPNWLQYETWKNESAAAVASRLSGGINRKKNPSLGGCREGLCGPARLHLFQHVLSFSFSGDECAVIQICPRTCEMIVVSERNRLPAPSDSINQTSSTAGRFCLLKITI